MRQTIILCAALLTSTSAAFAQEAAPRQYKLQQPGLMEQMRQLKPIEQTREAFTSEQYQALHQQVLKCWAVPRQLPQNPVVVLRVNYSPEGRPLEFIVSHDPVRMVTDEDYRSFTKSATDAVRQCSPLKGLENIPYEAWSSLEFPFDATPRVNAR